MKKQVADKILTENRRGYNQIAQKFSQTRKFPWHEFNFFKEYIQPDDEVLDAGCGSGRLYEFLQKSKVNYTGLDTSQKLITTAKANFPSANFIIGDILNLPFSDNKFNAIFCIATLHHIPGQKLRLQAIQEISRILKNNGYLIMTNWNLWQKIWWPMLIQNSLKKITGQSQLDWWDIMKPWKNEQGIIITKRYIHSFTPRELKKLLKKGGLAPLKQYYTRKGLPANRLTGYNLITVAKKP